MFRNQDQVRNDFQCIVAVIKRLLVPKIARNIANQVLGGKTFDLSPFCKFTQQGICITRVKLQGTRSRELKTNVESRPSRPSRPTSESFVVSYIDLELRAENRFLEIGPKGNPKGFYTQISRDDWNAEIIEGIAKNIFTPTTNNPQSNKDAEAIYERGVKCLYEEIKDYAQAALFFKEAAELDHAKAQFMLGNLYLHGQGVVKNENEAVKWFHKAAASDPEQLTDAVERIDQLNGITFELDDEDEDQSEDIAEGGGDEEIKN